MADHDSPPPPTAPPPLKPVRQLRPGPILQLGSPVGFEWNAYDLPLPNLPPVLEGLRIIHLTDVHLRPRWWSAYDEVLQRIADADADFVFVTGDLIEHKFDHRATVPIAERFCTALRARRGVFMTLGNHDGDLFAGHVARFGIQLLNRKTTRLEVNGETIELIGVPGVLRSDIPAFIADVARDPSHRAPAAIRLALTHFPDSIRQLRDLAPDIVFAGHTHGGQACLPTGRVGWPIIKHDTLPRAMCRGGVFRYNDAWLVISRGFGFATYSFRVFCPSEVIEVTLRRGSVPEPSPALTPH